MPKKVIKLEIESLPDREKMVTALAKNGYAVWVKKKEGNIINESKYFVCFYEDG